MSRRLDFELTEPQSKAFRLLQKTTIDVNLEWGRGNGKSWFDRFVSWMWVAQADGKSRLQLLEELGVLDRLTPKQQRAASKVKGVRIVYLMPTRKQFVDIHGSLLKGEVEDWGHLNPRPNWQSYKIEFPGGSWMMPFPAADHSSQRARGIRCDIVIVDECDDIDQSVFDSVVRPWFSEPWSLKIRLTSGTPKRGRNGLLYKRRELGRDPEFPRYHTILATYLDSPEIVDAEEVEDARRTTPPDVFAREWMCDYDSGEGLVYPEFSADFHLRPAPELHTFSEFHVGVDHGDVDPGVAILFGVQGHGNDARVWALDEWYEPGVLNSVWDERLTAWREPVPGVRSVYWPDPSRADRIRDWRALGLDVRAIPKEVKPIAAGIARMSELLFRRTHDEFDDWARFYVDPRCRNFIREFGLYRRKKLPDGSFSEDPEDKNNHSMDAARYCLAGRFGRVSSGRTLVSGS